MRRPPSTAPSKRSSRANLDLALQVKTDDTVIDQLEVEVDNIAIHLLSKAPLARDPALRDRRS